MIEWDKNTNKWVMHSKLNIKIALWLIALFALTLRLYFNFAQELIPGVNGGYYPLQVRAVLNTGTLAFTDMPFLFYLDAFVVKLLDISGFDITNLLIIIVVKLVDSISIPLLLIPLYKIILNLTNKIADWLKFSILAFAVLTFSPLILTSDLQKNALAITFMVAFLSTLFSYLQTKNVSQFLLLTGFLLLTAFTHFGTFVFALFFLMLLLVHIYRKKAIIPVVIIAGLGMGIIALFDITRFERVITLMIAIFEKPALLIGSIEPPDMLIIALSVFLGITGIITLIKKKINLTSIQKAIVFSCIVSLLTLSFPLLDAEYFKRLSLFLFIPQTVILIILSNTQSVKIQKLYSVGLILIVFLSVFAMLGHRKEPVLNEEAYLDLIKSGDTITEKDSSIIIARHGHEWWTAWALNTKVAQDKAIDESVLRKYKNIYIIHQINGFSSDARRTPFHEPEISRKTIMVYHSDFFKLYKLKY